MIRLLRRQSQFQEWRAGTGNGELAQLLDDILAKNTDGLRSLLNDKTLHEFKGRPLEHVFSHVRHSYKIDSGCLDHDPKLLSWQSANGRDVRWMRQSDMKEAGVTSGVLKMLKAVNEEQSKSKKRSGFFDPRRKSKI